MENEDKILVHLNLENNKFDTLIKGTLIIALILIMFSFFAPYIFTISSEISILSKKDFSKTGQIGDTIGGIMNPFIAIAGVIVTFLAFLMQFKANKNQLAQFKIQIDSQKTKYEEEKWLDVVRLQRNEFENQFFKMISFHKENTSEIFVQSLTGEIIGQGRTAFTYLLNELDLYFRIAKIEFYNQTPKVQLNEAYGIFFKGIVESQIENHNFFRTLWEIGNIQYVRSRKSIQDAVMEVKMIPFEKKVPQKICIGHASMLAHYYRHLFQTVKFVVKQNEKVISYNEKRNYLRILRSQLSNEEQVLLFYNWYSGFGKQWENDENKFFTDYRMIHNIYQSLLFEDISLNEVFPKSISFRNEEGRSKDSLFEFQDWL